MFSTSAFSFSAIAFQLLLGLNTNAESVQTILDRPTLQLPTIELLLISRPDGSIDLHGHPPLNALRSAQQTFVPNIYNGSGAGSGLYKTPHQMSDEMQRQMENDKVRRSGPVIEQNRSNLNSCGMECPSPLDGPGADLPDADDIDSPQRLAPTPGPATTSEPVD